MIYIALQTIIITTHQNKSTSYVVIQFYLIPFLSTGIWQITFNSVYNKEATVRNLDQ